jgi:DNA-binding protein HU-beta
MYMCQYDILVLIDCTFLLQVIGKTELLEKLTDKTGYKKKDIEAVMNALTEIMKEDVLEAGSQIRMRDFGTFKQKKTAARTGRNPRTGEAIPISASTTIAFSAAAAVKVKEVAK